jgi:hypothetical protein
MIRFSIFVFHYFRMQVYLLYNLLWVLFKDRDPKELEREVTYRKEIIVCGFFSVVVRYIWIGTASGKCFWKSKHLSDVDKMHVADLEKGWQAYAREVS